MLKRNGITACGLTSCRTTAEALARALNSRIWPHTWTGHSSNNRRDEAMQEEEDEFFETSPSPLEDESLINRGRHCSAATEQGRAKLYELLQQHVADDASDVFYDVSEHAGLSETGESGSEGSKLGIEVCESSDDFSNHCNKSDSSCEKNADISHLAEESRSVNGISINEGVPSTVESFSLSKMPLQTHVTDDRLSEINLQDVAECNGSINNDVPCTEDILHDTVYPEIVGDTLQNTTDNVCGDISENLHINSYIEEYDITPIKKDTSVSTEDFTTSDRTDSHADQNGAIEVEYNFVNRTTASGTEMCAISDTIPAMHKYENPFENHIQNDEKGNAVDRNNVELSNSNEYEDFEQDKQEDDEDEIAIEITSDSIPNGDIEPLGNLTSPSDNCRLKVFNELRPMISRSTSLKTGKTPPGTPSRKKIVRFADVLGLDLEDVRHIVSGDLPNIPSSAYNDLNLSEDDFGPTATEAPSNTVQLTSRQSSTWDNITSVASGPNVLYPKFTMPGHQPDFIERVRNQAVCLENVVASEFNNVQGTCLVMNWSFHKKVVVRYTTNAWASTQDINASYVSGSTLDGMDRFSFNIFLCPGHDNVEFAIRYEINGREYWDNNRGDNYCFSRHGNGMNTHVPVPISPSWMHQFW